MKKIARVRYLFFITPIFLNKNEKRGRGDRPDSAARLYCRAVTAIAKGDPHVLAGRPWHNWVRKDA